MADDSSRSTGVVGSGRGRRNAPTTASTPTATEPQAVPGARRPSTSTVRAARSAGSSGTVRRVDDSADLSSSADSFNTAQEPGSYMTRSEGTHPERRTSSASSYQAAKVTSPEILPRKPSYARVGSALSNRMEFSAEDYPEEIQDEVHSLRRTSTAASGYNFQRRGSGLRRRATAGSTQGTDGEDGEPVDETDNGFDQSEDNSGDGEDMTVRGQSYNASVADSVESFTLKDRQEAINTTHPFGIRIWKPALYKKLRSVQKTAEGDIHSGPDVSVSIWITLINLLWVPTFGIWLAAACTLASFSCYLFAMTESGREYGDVLLGLAGYLLYPFGKFVELTTEEAYLEEDEGEGRSITEYEQWNAGDLEEGGGTFFGPRTPRSLIGRRRASLESASEVDSLLGRNERRGDYSSIERDSPSPSRQTKRRLFGRGEWNVGRIVFFAWFYGVITPMMYLVCLICWWLVFTIPMAKVNQLLLSHLRRHPLALSFHSDSTYRGRPANGNSSILLCTHRAAGWKYYKYTIDGTNIFFINLMSVVVFVLVDFFVLRERLHLDSFITSQAFIFILSLLSIIPLAYFIGQAVASISAQSSMGMGATINAFFSTIVEVYLYCVALKDGKGRLVEGSIVGSILAGILFMPGISMCSGAIRRKTQRFNAKSAGVTSTMLLFAIIGAFAPTLFYQIYGTYELRCRTCFDGEVSVLDQECQRCLFTQTPSISDSFYTDAVRPFCYISSFLLFCAYGIGLLFTLRTHAASIWATDPLPIPPQYPRHQHQTSPHITREQRGSVKESTLYKRVLGATASTVGMSVGPGEAPQTPHIVPPRTEELDRTSTDSMRPPEFSVPQYTVAVPGLAYEAPELARSVVEAAATAATVAVQESRRQKLASKPSAMQLPPAAVAHEEHDDTIALGESAAHGASGGHDAPNWSRMKSSIILIGATVLYAAVAEVLVDTVDVVLSNMDIDEKFLGMTLFALVPNTTEFLNAISFAMNGNIALSMEIGSAYALQVCMLQIPCLVAYSAYVNVKRGDSLLSHTFTLIFPQWDLVTVVLCVFLLSYMYGEGKSNYFKGSILLLSYVTVMLGFFFSVYADPAVERSFRSSAYTTVGVGGRGYRPVPVPKLQ